MISVPLFWQGWTLLSRFISQNALRKQHGNKSGKKRTPAADTTAHERLSIPYHNASTLLAAESAVQPSSGSTDVGGGGKDGGIVYDLQLDSPPVLFIRKYGRTLDTRDVILANQLTGDVIRADQLTGMEKDATLTLTPQTLTHTKIRLIQEAVRRSPTFEKLAQSFLQRRPTPPGALLAPAVADTPELKRSVFTDSDFENIRWAGYTYKYGVLARYLSMVRCGSRFFWF
jgi:hypothetical protein